MQYNLYCFSCSADYTAPVEVTWEYTNEYGVWDVTECAYCGGPAKIIGRPAAVTTMKPPWADSEALIHSGSAEEQVRAGDHFLEQRRKWANSGKWKSWEEGRKQSWAQSKPAWHKERMAQEEKKKQDFIKKGLH